MNFDQKPQIESSSSSNLAWESREPFDFSKDYFKLQYDFAKILQEKRGIPLFDAIKETTSALRLNAFEYDDFNNFKGISSEVTEENIVDIAYANELKEENGGPVPYHTKDSTRFGCFSYEQQDKQTPTSINIHFFNGEFDPNTGPLDKSKIEKRKKEIHDVLVDIKRNYPDAKEICGLSWIYNIQSYKRLFPDSYIKNLQMDEREILWTRGTTVWGQFLDNQYKLKQDIANELLLRAKELSKEDSLSKLFKNGSQLMPPLATHGPVEDFYKMYKI